MSVKLLPTYFLGGFMALASALGADPPASKPMPDFCQENKNLPDNGSTYCGPVAASNILVHLDRNRFQNLLDVTDPADNDQLELIKLLGSNRYMRTSLHGTPPINLMSGLEQYITDRGYTPSIKWRGKESGGKYASGTELPDPAWLKKEIENGSHAILIMGFYEKLEGGITLFLRSGAHYVTLNGFKSDREIFIHDPGPHSGKEPKKELYKLVPIQDGRMGSGLGGSVRSANGYWMLEAINPINPSPVLILEGVVVFNIENRVAAR